MEDFRIAAASMGIALSANQLAQFETYYQELQRWNQRVNLTRISDRQAVISKHFLDSLSCLIAIPTLPQTMIDVGTGPGFPGLVLKIVQPHLQLTLVEATRKKADFLNHLLVRLGLPDVIVLNARAEEIGQHPEHREYYHLAVARAVAPLVVLVEYLLPLLQIGGVMLAQKGAEPTAEITAATKAMLTLGGRSMKTIPITIPGMDASRHLVLAEKVKPTPNQYPRRPGIPAKRPIS